MAGHGEELATWIKPRPRYMRELEPLAHDAAWPSVDPIAHVDPKEQELNRKTFLEGRKRLGKSIGEIREKKAG